MRACVAGWAAAEARPLDRAVFWGIGFDVLSGYCVWLPATGNVVPWSVRSGGLTVGDFVELGNLMAGSAIGQCVLVT